MFLKASDTIKKLSLILLCIILSAFSVSCSKTTFNKSNFQDVNFTEQQKVQLVTNDSVYNILVSLNENNEFTLTFLDEAPEIYKNISVEIKNDICIISSDGILYEKNINEFNNLFLPKIIYIFLSETDFKTATFICNEAEKSYYLEKSVCEKTVVFTVQLSLDESTQNYILEIR